MARGNGFSAGDYEARSQAEAAVVEEHEGLRWLADRMRAIRIEILRLLTYGGGFDLGLELELRQLQDEFRRVANEGEADG